MMTYLKLDPPVGWSSVCCKTELFSSFIPCLTFDCRSMVSPRAPCTEICKSSIHILMLPNCSECSPLINANCEDSPYYKHATLQGVHLVSLALGETWAGQGACLSFQICQMWNTSAATLLKPSQTVHPCHPREAIFHVWPSPEGKNYLMERGLPEVDLIRKHTKFRPRWTNLQIGLPQQGSEVWTPMWLLPAGIPRVVALLWMVWNPSGQRDADQ